MKEMLPEVKDPLLNIINSSLSLGYIPKRFRLAMIKSLVKKTQLNPTPDSKLTRVRQKAQMDNAR